MKKTIIAGIIGLILIAAAIAGFGMLFDKVEAYLPELEDVSTEDVTNKPSGGSSTTEPSTSVPSDEIPDFVVYGDVGYSIVNGYTYFFVSYTNGSEKTLYWNCHDSSGNDGVKPFGIYEPYVALSTDGYIWALDEYTVHEFAVNPEKTIYVSYTRVKNCSDPEAVLEELSDYVFYNEYYFDWSVQDTPG